MTWSEFYLICFFVGFGLSALTLVAGSAHLHLPHLHLHHGMHLGHAHGVHGAAGSGRPRLPGCSLVACLYGRQSGLTSGQQAGDDNDGDDRKAEGLRSHFASPRGILQPSGRASPGGGPGARSPAAWSPTGRAARNSTGAAAARAWPFTFRRWATNVERSWYCTTSANCAASNGCDTNSSRTCRMSCELR